MEQTGKRETLAKGRTVSQRSLSLVFLLIRWLGALPSHHRQTLGREKSRGGFREVEARCLVVDDRVQTLLTLGLQTIAEGDVVVRYAEGDDQRQSLAIDVGEVGLTCHIVGRRGLGARHCVAAVDVAEAYILEAQSTGEVTQVALQSQRRGLEECLTSIGDRIGDEASLVGNRHSHPAVGRLDGSFLSMHGERNTRQQQ